MKKISIILTLMLFVFGAFLLTKYIFFNHNINSDFEISSDGNEVTITRDIGNDKAIIIPSNINGKLVYCNI